MLGINACECVATSENETSIVTPLDFYVYLDHHCRQKAAKESKDFEEFAKCFSKYRKNQDDNFLKDLSSKAECYIFEQMQQNVFHELWQEASKAVFGQWVQWELIVSDNGSIIDSKWKTNYCAHICNINLCSTMILVE